MSVLLPAALSGCELHFGLQFARPEHEAAAKLQDLAQGGGGPHRQGVMAPMLGPRLASQA